MLTRMSFHSATISTIFNDYNSLLMLENLPFNVIITNKIPMFIRFIKLACRFGHSKEKWIFLHLYIIRTPNYLEILPGKKHNDNTRA